LKKNEYWFIVSDECAAVFNLIGNLFSIILYLYKSEFTDVLRELVTLSQELFKRGKA